MVRCLALVVTLALAACATSVGPSGERAVATVDAYRRAVEADDPRAAYALLSPRVQRDVPFSRFEASWQAQKADRARQAKALAAGAVVPVRSTTIVDLGDGQHAELVYQDGGWRLERPLFGAEGAATPQEALARFGEAIDGRNLLALSPLLTRSYRESLLRTLDGLGRAVRSPRDREITVVGERAHVVAKVGQTAWRIDLVREGGVWIITAIRPFEPSR